MDIMNKLGRFARKAGNKAGDILEIGRLTAKIHAEKAACDRVKLQIGEYIWNQYQAEGQQPAVVAELCEKIRDSMAAIEILQNAVLDIKAPRSDEDCVCQCCCEDESPCDCKDEDDSCDCGCDHSAQE